MTLTETAAQTKKWLKLILFFGSIFIVLWLIFLFVYNNVWLPYQRNQIRPEQRFGPLAKPKFSASASSPSDFDYSLDTDSGGLPNNLPKLLNVYFIPSQETTLLAPDRAKRLANSLGFTSEPEILSPSEYRYSDKYGGQLTVELSTGNFTYNRVIPDKVDGVILRQETPLGGESDMVSSLIYFLSNRGFLQANFNKPRSVITYDNSNHQLAQTARIALWPNNIGNYPIVTDDTSTGPITATLTKNNDSNFRYTKFSYSVWSYDTQTFSTYALEPIDKAFANLKSGQGVVVKSNAKKGHASVTKVYIAYYMSSQYQPYLEPVYVFEGDNFTAYVPALSQDSYAK